MIFTFRKCTILLGFIFLVASQQSESLEESIFQFKIDINEKIKAMVQEIEKSYQSNSQKECFSSNTNAYNGCHGTSQPFCIQDFPHHSSCLTSGVYMSEQAFYINQHSTSLKNLTCEEIAFISNAGSSRVSNVFSKTIGFERNYQYGTAFYGSPSGIFLSYPATLQYEQFCKLYDPRLRPWYNIGSTGMKSTVVFFQIREKKNIKRAKQIGDYLVDTANPNDWLLVVDLNNCTKKSICQVQGKATTQYQQKVKEYMSKLSTGNTPLSSISDSSSELFSTEMLGNIKTKRNNIVLVTDEIPNTQELFKQLNELDHYIPRLFPIIIGNSNSNVSNLQQLTVSTNGILIQDAKTTEYVSTVMKRYSQYFTQGLDIARPMWTQIYEDSFGFGEMITVVMPAYVRNETSGQVKLIAVAGIDVPLSSLRQSFELSDKQVFEHFPNSVNSYVQELSYIEDTFYDGLINQSLIKWETSSMNSHDNICCSLTVTEFIIMIVLLIVLIITIISIIVCYKKKLACFKEKKESENKAIEVSKKDNQIMPDSQRVMKTQGSKIDPENGQKIDLQSKINSQKVLMEHKESEK